VEMSTNTMIFLSFFICGIFADSNGLSFALYAACTPVQPGLGVAALSACFNCETSSNPFSPFVIDNSDYGTCNDGTIFLVVNTSSSFSSVPVSLNFSFSSFVSYANVYNQCSLNKGDNAQYCGNGVSAFGVSLASNNQLGGVIISLTKLGKSSTAVIRIDYTFVTCESPNGGAIVLKSYTIGTGVVVVPYVTLSFANTFMNTACMSPADCTTGVINPCDNGDAVLDCSACDKRKRQWEGFSFTPIMCDDGNECTDDSCDSTSGCVFTPIVCNDNNSCTNDSCDPTSGCVFTPIVCNDNNSYTSDSCDPTCGCVFTPIVKKGRRKKHKKGKKGK